MPRCAEPRCQRWRPFASLPGRHLRSFHLNGGWYCSRACLEAAALSGLTRRGDSARPPALAPLKLGVLLRHMKAITEEQLLVALETQRTTGLRLGAQLRAQGAATSDAVLRALAAQANISYLGTFNASQLRSAAGVLPIGTVRALGLVPIDGDPVAGRLRVICRAPVQHAAIRALATLTACTVEPFLVADDVWTEVVMTYRPRCSDAEMDTLTVPSVGDAVLHIGRAAERLRAITMRSAAWQRCLLVRVEASHHVSDVLVGSV